jgi:hypothetical protein
MRRTLIALAASSVIGAAGIAAPSTANAHAWWVAPAIVGGALVTGAVIANSAHANPYYANPYYGNPYYGSYYGAPPAYYGGPTVTVRTHCRTVREQTMDGWRRVRVCD